MTRSNDTLTAVDGIQVGHWTGEGTGCTVVVLPEPNTVAVEVRGAAPGTRETALLAPGMSVQQVQAILLTGGSAFGLAAADGVMKALEAEGRGHPTPAGPVPIVPGAVIFDLFGREPSFRPGPTEGEAAFRNATGNRVERGAVGASAGATAGKWRGLEQAVPTGLGSAAVRSGEVVVGALAVVNAVGDVFSLEGESLTGGHPVPGPPPQLLGDTNTTLAVVATNVALSRMDLLRVCVRSHDAYGVCLRPSHTRYDGDLCFALSVGFVDASIDLVAEMAFEAVGRAIADSVIIP